MFFFVFFFNLKGNVLTKSDIQILNIVLAEHLSKLEDSNLNLNQDDHPRITKEEVVIHLQKIEQHEFARILSESKGNVTKRISSIK